MSEIHSTEQTKESKIVATERLRKEGRWNEASLFKDEAIKRLRAEGRTKSEASEAAWDEMLAKFPPLPEQTAAPTNALDLSDADDRLLDRLAAQSIDWYRDVRWVYSNFSHPRVKLKSAPSLAAWGLLKFARSEPLKFFGQLLPPVLESQHEPQEEAQDEPPKPRPDPGIAEIAKLMEMCKPP